MDLLGHIALIAMGMVLGLVGAGGSILTVPILVYLFGVPILLATSYSLVVVGSTTLMATVRYRHHIMFKKAILFLIPSVLGVWGTRYLIIPNLPHTVGIFSMDQIVMILLLVFMSVSGYFMIQGSPIDTEDHVAKNQPITVVLIALMLGILMGILGAGGGFLIIPTLVLLLGLKMQEAIPTSLFIITVNALVGFVADPHDFMPSDWENLKIYLRPALLGMIIGLYISTLIKGERLKKPFGYFIWVIGILILIKELMG